MKPSRGKDIKKRGTVPSHATHNGLVRSSSKKQNQLNSSNTKSDVATSSSNLSTSQRPHRLPRNHPPSTTIAGSRPSKEKLSNLVKNSAVSYDYDAVVEITPLNSKNRIKDETDDDDHDNKTATSKTPPVEASVSPELQMMLTTMTPATGHHIHTTVSGITDNRKCRARGLLAATKMLSDADLENPLSFPSHASMQWLDDHSPTLPFATNSSPATSTCTSNCSTNLIRTPASADSDSSVSYIKNLLNKTNPFHSQLDSVAEPLHGTNIDISFEFDAVATASSSSIDLSHFRAQLLTMSCCSDADDVDQLDCCRCSSDDENPNIIFDEIVSPIEAKAFQQGHVSGSCAESISTDGGGPLVSKDSDWDFDLQL